MNSFLEKGIIREMTLDSNFAYILDDNSRFSSTNYKVLQSQNDTQFIKCVKMLFNGKTAFLYITKNFKSLQTMISGIDIDTFMAIITNLFEAILEVKNNGFLICHNVVISFDKIFVDLDTLKVKLVYLPIDKKEAEDYLSFETDLRSSIIKLINETDSMYTEKTQSIIRALSNASIGLEELCNILKGNVNSINNRMSSKNDSNDKNMYFVAVDSPSPIEIKITKNEFVIGKNANQVDGAITFNKAISRVHCKITKRENKYMLTDLGSANGTYVDNRRLTPDVSEEISVGSIIRLANSDFKIVFK